MQIYFSEWNIGLNYLVCIIQDVFSKLNILFQNRIVMSVHYEFKIQSLVIWKNKLGLYLSSK